MSNNYDATKKVVLNAVRNRAEQTKPSQPKLRNGAKLLGEYLQNCLKERGMGRVAFAQSLDMEPELADAILDGVLPESELHTELLGELADVLGCDHEHLAHILKGNSETSSDSWFSPV
jgi:hypothetical protein